MATYAQAADLVAYVAGTAYEARIPDDDPGRDRLLELAEGDLDSLAFPALPETDYIADTNSGRKVLLSDLTVAQKKSLNAATCAQAVYRVEMGDEHFVRAQREQVTGLRGSFGAVGRLPILGPQASRELSSLGMFRRTTHTGRRRDWSEADRFLRW